MNSELDEIGHFQLSVARHWIKRAEEVRDRPEFEFFAYFSAINALYWLWGLVDGPESSKKFSSDEKDIVSNALKAQGVDDLLAEDVVRRMEGTNDVALLGNLVERLDEDVATELLKTHTESVVHLLKRGPIRRMDRRSITNAGGSPREGKQYHGKLKNTNLPGRERLRALAAILYLIRCNLVHGSKISDAMDHDLLRLCVPPLRSLAEATYKQTKILLS